MRFSTSLLVGAAALIAPAVAQTFTSCNPMWGNMTCPEDPALGISHDFYFNSSTTVTNSFSILPGASPSYGLNGTEFTVAKQGDAPTIKSQFYIFFGSVSVVMKAAYGQGIVSSIVLESDDLDEVDWEFLGGNGTHAETNYFGKGNTTSYDRAIWYPMADPRADFHNYTVLWTSDSIQWYIDSNLVRTLPYAAALNGYDFPQTPMTVRMGSWAGGDPSLPEGTIEWAGGKTDYSGGPYTMYVQSVSVNDFSHGSSYQYSDTSGSYQSIKVIAGNSTAQQTIEKASQPSDSLSTKWNNMSSTAKLGVYCGAGAVGALLLGALSFVCFRQRRAGRRERDAYNAKIEQERADSYAEQIQLREKGLGGFDANSKQGEDALGGWGGNHATDAERSAMLADSERSPLPRGMTNEYPSASRNSPGAGSDYFSSQGPPRVQTPAGMSGFNFTQDQPPRMQSPGMQAPARLQTPSLVSPKPQSPSNFNEEHFMNSPRSPVGSTFARSQSNGMPPQRSFRNSGGYSRF